MFVLRALRRGQRMVRHVVACRGRRIQGFLVELMGQHEQSYRDRSCAPDCVRVWRRKEPVPAPAKENRLCVSSFSILLQRGLQGTLGEALETAEDQLLML